MSSRASVPSCTGSVREWPGPVADGEDIIQETLTRAYASLSQLEKIGQLRPWLFRIAHTPAIDHLRGYEHRMREPLDAIRPEDGVADAIAADDRLARDEAVRAALSRFIELPSLQRSCVILEDVLEHSIAVPGPVPSHGRSR